MTTTEHSTPLPPLPPDMLSSGTSLPLPLRRPPTSPCHSSGGGSSGGGSSGGSSTSTCMVSHLHVALLPLQPPPALPQPTGSVTGSSLTGHQLSLASLTPQGSFTTRFIAASGLNQTTLDGSYGEAGLPTAPPPPPASGLLSHLSLPVRAGGREGQAGGTGQGEAAAGGGRGVVRMGSMAAVGGEPLGATGYPLPAYPPLRIRTGHDASTEAAAGRGEGDPAVKAAAAAPAAAAAAAGGTAGAVGQAGRDSMPKAPPRGVQQPAPPPGLLAGQLLLLQPDLGLPAADPPHSNAGPLQPLPGLPPSPPLTHTTAAASDYMEDASLLPHLAPTAPPTSGAGHAPAGHTLTGHTLAPMGCDVEKGLALGSSMGVGGGPGAETAEGEGACSSSSSCSWWLDRTLMPLVLPLAALWWALAFLMAWLVTLNIWPSVLLARRLYWACPFIPHIFQQMGPGRGWALRIGFEASYCINVLTRMLTLPMRRHLPHFYIVGFPKCGTTSLAEHLKRHPGISCPAGLPYHEAMAKETHFFEGVLGQEAAHGAQLYRSFFPTIMQRWWAEVVQGVPKWMCFDACPVHACLPYVAKRIAAVTPHAKIVIMVRDPVAGVFSAETMLSDMGVPLTWQSLSEACKLGEDPRFQPSSKEEIELWSQVAQLSPTARLPDAMPHALYYTLGGVLRCGQYLDLLQPYFASFPAENIMVVNLNDFKDHPEQVIRDVLQFVGASQEHFKYAPLPPAMQNNYAGRKLHPVNAARLRALYRPSVRRLQALLQRDLGWGLEKDAEAAI